MRDLRQDISLPTGAVHRLILERVHAHLLELDELCFHARSAVLLPAHGEAPCARSWQQSDRKLQIVPLRAIQAAFELAGKYADRKLLVAGHTDSTGGAASNITLARLRAQNVQLFLQGDRAGWAAGCARHEVRDVQVVLTWAARAHGFACWPGPVDDRVGPRTREAIARFRQRYNFEFSGSLADGADWDEKDWRAVYDLYELTICRYLGVAEGSLTSDRAKFHFASPPLLACGEHWPVEGVDIDNLRSRTNGRVDLFWVEAKPYDDLQGQRPPGYDLYGHALAFEKEAVVPTEQPDELPFESKLALELACSFAREMTADGFAIWGSLVFGPDIPRAALLRLHADLRETAVPLPTFAFSPELDRHLGAYKSSARCIQLNEQLVVDACGEPSLASVLVSVLVEEFGHHLDLLLRTEYSSIGGDAPLDEGARFAYLLLCHQLAGPDSFDVGIYRYDQQEHVIRADWAPLKNQLADLLGAEQQASDEASADLEFSDSALPLEAMSSEDAKQITAIHLIVAGAGTMDAHALVALAQKLAAQLRGESGAAVLLEGTVGKPSALTEQVLLGSLLGLYQALDQRLRDAPLSADGLPDLGTSAWSGEPMASLWARGSPLAGIIDDIIPFGSQQEWLMRYRRIEPARTQRRKRVEMQWDAPTGNSSIREFDPGEIGQSSVEGASLGALLENREPDSLNDDALNAVERSIGAVDTVFGLLELVAVETIATPILAVAGPALGVATFLRGVAIADEQQRRGAEGLGAVFAWYALDATARDPAALPVALTRALVERIAGMDHDLRRARESVLLMRGTTPEQLVRAGIDAGIQRVLMPLNEALKRVDELAAMAFEQMQLRASVRNLDASMLVRRFPLAWWKVDMRRRVYAEMADKMRTNGYALYTRFRTTAR